MPNSSVGSAVVLILETADGFHYGGCHYSSVVTENTSNAGEDAAIIWALLWATHLSNISNWRNTKQHCLSFSFNFDSTSAGFTAAGFWTASADPDRHIVKRSLAQLLQTRHGFQCTKWEHIKHILDTPGTNVLMHWQSMLLRAQLAHMSIFGSSGCLPHQS